MLSSKHIREVPAIPAELWQGIFALRSDSGIQSQPTINWFDKNNLDISYKQAIFKATELSSILEKGK
jgi:hypothetical protein